MSESTVTIKGRAPGEADTSLSRERIIGGILQVLRQGNVTQAVDVYQRCSDDIGYELIARASTDTELFQQTANLFFQARDYSRAAYVCEQLEEYLKAAELYERCDAWGSAAQSYARAGERARAAVMFEKDGSFTDAAILFRDLKEPLRAAVCFERAKRPFEAAMLYKEAGKLEKAIELLNALEEGSADRKAAAPVLKELMAEVASKRTTTGQMRASPASALPSPPLMTVVEGAPALSSELPLILEEVADAEPHVVQMMEGFEFLRELPLFATLSLPELKALHHVCEPRDMAPGEVLIQAGLPSSALFVVMSGALDVNTTTGEHLARLGRGEHAGEMSLVDDASAAVNVVCAEGGRLLALDKAGFRHLLATSDALALRVMRVFIHVLIERLRDTTARLAR